MRITNAQKQELALLIKNHGLNGLDFETTGQYKEFKVKYKHEYFSFSINRQKEDVYYLTIFPIDNTGGYSCGATWESTKQRFNNWAKQIAEEINTPTGWESFQDDHFLNSDLEEIGKDFSDSEKLHTKQSIEQLRKSVKTLELPASSIKIIEKKLDDLSSKVDELKKFDWKSLFLGTMMSLVLVLGIPPEASGLLWDYIKSAFSKLKLK